VDTPIFQHAATYTDRRPKAVPPVIGPNRVVRAILRSVEHPRRQRSVGAFARFLEFGHAVVPGFYSRSVPTVMNLVAFSRHRATPNAGNLFEPMREWNKVEGGWRHTPVRVIVGAGAATAVIGTAVTARRWAHH
jgi:hypothetical protein